MPEPPIKTPEPETLRLFVDEAGTPTLFQDSGKRIADTYGCSRFFILGKLEVEDPATSEKQLDAGTGLVIREDRFLNAIWPQVGEIHDLHFGPAGGTFYTTENPLRLTERFPAAKERKKKKPRV